MPRSLLAIYLRDHHAAAMAGVRLARRAASADAHPIADDLQRVASEIAEDLAALKRIMRVLGVGRDAAKDVFARLGERLSLLKLNGRVVRRSALSDLLELETLLVGITGKRALWLSLRAGSSVSTELLDRLIERAEGQLRVVEEARLQAARRAFRHEPAQTLT